MISSGEIAQFNRATLPQRMKVYTASAATGPTGGRFDVLAASDIRCRRIDPAVGGRSRAQERAAFEDQDRINWEATYTLPAEPCQVEIGGARFQVVSGSVRDRLGPSGEVLVKTALITPVGV